MRKKVSVDTIQRENGEKENHEVSQTALDKRVNSDSEAAPLNGNHNNNSDLDDHDDDNFDEEEKGDPRTDPKSENQEELP